MSPTLAERLEGVPLWPFTAIRALVAAKEELRAIGQGAPPELRLVWAELTRATGDGVTAQALSASVDPTQVDRPRRRRLAFLRGHFLQALPGAPASRLTDPSPLGRARQDTLLARHALLQTDPAGAEAAFRRVLSTTATGRRADELVYEAAAWTGGHLVQHGDAAEGLELLAWAEELAVRHHAPADRASLHARMLHGLQRAGDRDGLRRLARRAVDLPTDVPGALPPAVVQQFLAADEALGGLPLQALKRLHREKLAARDRSDWAGYASLAVSEARMSEPADPYFSFRTLKLAGVHLRKAGQPDLDRLVAKEAADLVARHAGATAWPDRLRSELTS